MQIEMYDIDQHLRPLFEQSSRPRDRFAQAQETLFSPEALAAGRQKLRARQGAGGTAIMETALQDGSAVLTGQQAWGLFNPARKPAASAWAFAQFEQRALLSSAATWLNRCARALPPELLPERLNCFIVPGDPANRTFMIMNRGLSGFAGIPGDLLLEIWPSGGNLARLRPVLARLMAHTARWSFMGDQPATLGDLLALEGLAAAFVAAMCPEHQEDAWCIAFSTPPDWEAALQQVAELQEAPTFAEMRFNIYGMWDTMGDERPPEPASLDPEERAYTIELLAPALDETDPATIAAYLYGDTLVAAQGHPAAGVSPYAGFAVAATHIQAYLAATGQAPADALSTPTATLLQDFGR